jgi:hypothetical protein
MLFSKQQPRYQSEFTLFLDNLKKSKPELEKGQLAGRALLWDKNPIDLETQQRIQDSTLAQQAYVYQNKL